MKINARAPLRLGLAGGGSDVSPYCDTFGGQVLNATIGRYAYAQLELNDTNHLRFESLDRATSVQVDDFAKRPKTLELHWAVYKAIISKFNSGKKINLSLKTYTDAPVGSGLGGSSTLVVAMIKAFDKLLELNLTNYEIASLAFEIERVDCGLQGGRQDQYSAAFGGFNFMEFSRDESRVTPLQIAPRVIAELEASLILFFTGVSRESGKIILDQSNSINESGKSLDAMHDLRLEAARMRDSLESGNFEELISSMRMGWESKKRTSAAVSNQHLDSIYSTAIEAGALAGKVSGAGGGGFMLFFAPIENRSNVLQALRRFEGEASNCHFSKEGAQAWTVN
jgi:D-glycero-alpha-D-manno-heptose-7-phosphate kinase